MINPTRATSEIKAEGIEESMDFMLDPAATAHILNMLRSGVYKDPKAACVREYWCNARDSVIEAGKDPSKHVTITLPNIYEPYLKIKDEGLGLSEADFRRIFRKYGASTKRESNETIGCLGIGSKSAFSYSDTFTVTAIKNGVKRVFIASVARDSVAKDGIGNLNRVVEIDTDEPNGIEVSIPVKDTDFHDFKEKVCHFLSFIPVDQRPIVKGIRQSLVEIPIRPESFVGANWRVTNEGNSYAIMGGVPYNLDIRSMDLLTKQERGLIEIGVDIVFPIGSFEFAISREEVRYTELSQNAIKAELQKIIAELSVEISKKFSTAQSIWEAKFIYHSIYQNGSVDAKIIRNCFTDDQKIFLNWNGKPVTDSTFKGFSNVYIYSCALSWDGKIDKATIHEITVRTQEKPLLIVHDASRYGEWQRISTALKTPLASGATPANCYMIRFENDAAKDAFFKEYDFGSLNPTPLSVFERDKSISKASRAHARSFTFDYSASLNNELSWEADDQCEFDKGGFYIELKKGYSIDNPLRSQGISAAQMHGVLEHMKDMGKKIDVLWGFKPSIVAKLDKTKWTEVVSLFFSTTKDYLVTNNAFQVDESSSKFHEICRGAIDRLNTSYNKSDYEALLPLITKSDSLFKKYMETKAVLDAKFAEDSPFDSLIAIYEKLGAQVYSLRNIKVGPSQEVIDFEKLSFETVSKYPMLRLFYSFNTNDHAMIADYINQKDS